LILNHLDKLLLCWTAGDFHRQPKESNRKYLGQIYVD
jgi:hypothetical protein